MAKFRVAAPQRLVFTKLDETTSFGAILNVCFHDRKPVSLLTCGQNVPDDVIWPTQTQLIKLAANRSYYRDEFLSLISGAGKA
jgi:flagellar biosynthesis protein FlhF